MDAPNSDRNAFVEPYMDVNGVAMNEAGDDVNATPPGLPSACIRPMKWWVISTAAVALQCRFARCVWIGIDVKKPIIRERCESEAKAEENVKRR